jgi:hypothetical protein
MSIMHAGPSGQISRGSNRAWASTLSPVSDDPDLEVIDDDMVLAVEPLLSPRAETELEILAEAVELVEQVLESQLCIAPAGHLMVDEQMILDAEPAILPHRWGPLGDTIERWFEQGEAGAWVDGADELDPWIVVDGAARARHALFEAADDTDSHVDVFLPRA